MDWQRSLHGAPLAAFYFFWSWKVGMQCIFSASSLAESMLAPYLLECLRRTRYKCAEHHIHPNRRIYLFLPPSQDILAIFAPFSHHVPNLVGMAHLLFFGVGGRPKSLTSFSGPSLQQVDEMPSSKIHLPKRDFTMFIFAWETFQFPMFFFRTQRAATNPPAR